MNGPWRRRKQPTRPDPVIGMLTRKRSEYLVHFDNFAFCSFIGLSQRWIIIFLLRQISRLLAPAKGCSLLIPFFIRDSVSGDQWNVSSNRNLKRLAANDSVTSPSRQTLKMSHCPHHVDLGMMNMMNNKIMTYQAIQVLKENPRNCASKDPRQHI